MTVELLVKELLRIKDGQHLECSIRFFDRKEGGFKEVPVTAVIAVNSHVVIQGPDGK